MLDFLPLSVGDRDRLNGFLLKNTYRNSDFSFTNLFAWQHTYRTTFCIAEGFLFFRLSVNQASGYLMPLGEGDLKTALELLMQDAAGRGHTFRLYAVTEEMQARVEALYPGRFRYEIHRDWAEYLYLSEDLIALKGNKYQAKRNHINKFKRLYAYEYLPLTPELIPECRELYRQWGRENEGYGEEESLREEALSVEAVFDHFGSLGLTGGALRVEGRIVAYSYGQPLGPDTFGIHAEKSLYEIEGGFTMINQQFAEYACAGFRYINREEDLGLESLRQAKLSYHPFQLLSIGYLRPR